MTQVATIHILKMPHDTTLCGLKIEGKKGHTWVSPRFKTEATCVNCINQANEPGNSFNDLMERFRTFEISPAQFHQAVMVLATRVR